jgi:hypothetical protein
MAWAAKGRRARGISGRDRRERRRWSCGTSHLQSIRQSLKKKRPSCGKAVMRCKRTQFDFSLIRMTFLSYSASVARVISLPPAANTRPPLRRHAFRSYWQGPISGCLTHMAATFGENSMTICWRWPAASVTHTYCALGGSTIAASGAGTRIPGRASGGVGIGVSGSGRRTTGALARSSGGVAGKGAFAPSRAHPAARSRITAAKKALPALDICRVRRREGRYDRRYDGVRPWSLSTI